MRRVQKIVTPPTVTPVTLATAKAHARVTFSDDDDLIEIYINSATALCEQILQRKMITQTWKMYLDYWPQEITTIWGDLQSVTSIKYTDIDEDQLTFADTNYDVDINSVPGRVVLKDSISWPTVTLNAVNPIEIEFVTGYGDAATNVPADITNAVLLATSHFYENRESILVSDIKLMTVEQIPWTASTLLQNHRVWRWCI
jgi:uncharacterized phiE125 gp8 family phage protein